MMGAEVISRNIKRIRGAKEFSQARLAEQAGLSLPAIKKIEAANSNPRVDTLRSIALALGVSLADLLTPEKILRNVRFRSKKRLKCRDNIINQVSSWLADYNYLEDLLGEREPFILAELAADAGRQSPLELAASCREKLGLKPYEPIHNLNGLLESIGVKVYFVSYVSSGFYGLCVGPEEGGPAVVVNISEQIPTERRLFSAAHELGHILMHKGSLNVDEAQEVEQEEKEADAFAGHLLLPNEGFQREWEAAAGLGFVDRVIKVKRIFRVSYKVILHRFVELGKFDSSIWQKFNQAYNRRYSVSLKFKKEPFGMKAIDAYEDRFKSLLNRALAKDLISISKGAEMMGVSVAEMRRLMLDWEIAD